MVNVPGSVLADVSISTESASTEYVVVMDFEVTELVSITDSTVVESVALIDLLLLNQLLL